MLKNIWKQFVSNNRHLSIEDPEFRSAYLLNIILLIGIVVSAILILLNIAFYTTFNLIILNTVAFLVFSGMKWYFYRSGNLNQVALFMSLLLLVIFILYFSIKGYRDYALVWMVVMPPVFYFLLGKKRGRIVTSSFLCFMGIFMIRNYSDWISGNFTTDSLYNIIIPTFVIVALMSYYEESRKEAYRALKQKNEELTYLSTRDSLTGLYNRAKLDDLLNYELIRVARTKVPFSIIIGDVDKFKRINDTYGHITGDAVLTEMGRVIKNICRELDSVGRWGGEEFLILCPNTDLKGVKLLAEKIRNRIEKHEFPCNEKITISLGIATYKQSDTVEMIIKRADDKLYMAKDNGRNCVG